MTTLALTVMLQSAFLSASGTTYAQAYRACMEDGRPMVILVGAEWCPACKVMETQVLPQMAQQGALSDVSLVVLDYDRHTALARKLMRGNSIPQLIVFHKSERGWHRNALIGRQNAAAVNSLVQRGVSEALAARAKEDDEVRVARKREQATRSAE